MNYYNMPGLYKFLILLGFLLIFGGLYNGLYFNRINSKKWETRKDPWILMGVGVFCCLFVMVTYKELKNQNLNNK